MRIEDYFIVVLLLLLFLFGVYATVKGDSTTSFRSPTAQELITSMRVDIISEVSELLQRTSTLSQIELATTLPCAQVRVSSSASNNTIYYGFETNFDGCR